MNNIENVGAVAVGSRLLIRITTVGDELPQSESGIILTDSFMDKQLAKGIVVNKGGKCSDEITVGDTIAFERHGIVEVAGLDSEYGIIDEDTVLVRYE